jgi:hypothetical protein
MSMRRCSDPMGASVGDSGPSQSSRMNSSIKSFKVRTGGSNDGDVVVIRANSAGDEASKSVSVLCRSPHISAAVMWGGLLNHSVLMQSVTNTLAASLPELILRFKCR